MTCEHSRPGAWPAVPPANKRAVQQHLAAAAMPARRNAVARLLDAARTERPAGDVRHTAPRPAETPEQALTRALNAAKLRRINEAMGICRDVLAATPDHPGALGLLGGILGQEGRADEAIAAISRPPLPGSRAWPTGISICARSIAARTCSTMRSRPGSKPYAQPGDGHPPRRTRAHAPDPRRT